MCLCQLDRWMVTEHSSEAGHHSNFKDNTVLTRLVGYMDSLVKEAVTIWLQTSDIKSILTWLITQEDFIECYSFLLFFTVSMINGSSM
jgi:hypothetical protein